MRIKDDGARSFYEVECAKQNWGVRWLQRQVGSSLYERIALSSDRDKVVRMAKEGEIIEKPADIIITDSGIPDTLREKIEDAGVQIIIAD